MRLSARPSARLSARTQCEDLVLGTSTSVTAALLLVEALVHSLMYGSWLKLLNAPLGVITEQADL